MDELPELPFRKVLSYLSLEEVIKLRAVSRSFQWKIDNYRVKRLCYSRVPIGHIVEKNLWVSGAFAQNLIVSIKFESFFKTFGQSILSHLKHLRLYDPDPHAGSRTAFTRTLNSLGQLEELDLVGKYCWKIEEKQRQLKLNLPTLKSVLFERVHGIKKLTLDAPILKKVKINRSSLFLDLVHGESVEWLFIDLMDLVNVESLKNLKAIYAGWRGEIDLLMLFGLKHLKAIYMVDIDTRGHCLFKLKQRHGRADLQIYRLGCLLSGPNDPASGSDFNRVNGANFHYLGANPSKMADKIPFWFALFYTGIEHLARQLQITILSRLTELAWLVLDRPVQDIDRFLEFLNTFNHIANLIVRGDQPQALLDRLPEYSGLQQLYLDTTPSDFEFLFRLTNLVCLRLSVEYRVDTKTIRRVLEELEFLNSFLCQYPNVIFKIQISITTPKRYTIYVREERMLTTCNLNVLIQFIKRNVTKE